MSGQGQIRTVTGGAFRDPVYTHDGNGRLIGAETITRAAVRIPGSFYSVPAPGRHSDVVRVAREDGYTGAVGGSRQGFLTSTGRFVDRKEAHRIASAAGQIVKRCGGDAETLYSENLW